MQGRNVDEAEKRGWGQKLIALSLEFFPQKRRYIEFLRGTVMRFEEVILKGENGG